MIQIGRYVVASSRDLGLDRKNYENDFNEYHVLDKEGNVYGFYRSMELAVNLAKGMHKSDLKQLNKEIDKILTTN